jgi:hypothetical protein
MVELEGIRIKNAFMKAESSTFINKRSRRIELNNGSSIKTHIIEILNKAFSNYRQDEELYKLWLVAYAQVFPDFVLHSFVAPSPIRMSSITKFGTIGMGGAEEGIGTIMDVDSIVAKVATKST